LDLVGLLRLIKKTGTVLDAVGASIGASDNAVGEGIFLGAVGASVRASDNVGVKASLLVLLASLLVLSALLSGLVIM